jgi:hypothetical protein
VHRGRTIPTVALASVAALAVLVALVLGYASRAFFDADRFAERASSALNDEAVRDEVAVRVADEVVEADPNLVAVRPVLESVAGGIVTSGAFQSLFRRGVADLHRTVLEGDQDTLTLTLVDIGATLRGALQALQPKLAAKLPAGGDVQLVDDQLPPVAAELARIADALRWLPIVALLVALAAAYGAVRLAPDRRWGVLAVGLAITLMAVIAVVALRGGEALVLHGIDDQQGRDAASGVWDAFLGDLKTALLLLAGCGAVVAAAASSLLRPVDLRTQIARAWGWVTYVPERPGWRALRAAVLVATGILVVVRNEEFLSLVATGVGLFVAYAGVAELMRLTLPEPEQAEHIERRGRAALVVAGIGAVVILGAGAIFIGAGGISERSLAVETSGCNGSDALCDQPFDEVAVPATHNSMSAASNPGWLFAQQERGIADQLHDGIRGLLIDAHYGVETQDGTIKTDLTGLDRGERATYEAELGESALDAALRIRDRVVSSPEVGEPGVYLCHRFCELGAIPIDQAFRDLRDFLAANSDEVVTVVIEDYVEPSDIAAAAERTGLIDEIYTGPVGDPWPTLEQMIDSGGRALMMAENDDGGSEFLWYHAAYDELVQETPYSFSKPGELVDPGKLRASCGPNRGPADAPLFLINHWIDTSPAPRPSNAAIVNEHRALLDRVEHCQRQRELTANLIAVDFYRRGDLFGVAEELNAGHSAG